MKGRCTISFIGGVRNGVVPGPAGHPQAGPGVRDLPSCRTPSLSQQPGSSSLSRRSPLTPLGILQKYGCGTGSRAGPPCSGSRDRPSYSNATQAWPSRPSAVEDSLGTRRPRRQPALGGGCRRSDPRSRSSRSRTRPRCQLGAPAAGHRDCRLRRRPGHGTDIEWGRTPALGLPQTQYQRPICPRHGAGYSHQEERIRGEA